MQKEGNLMLKIGRPLVLAAALTGCAGQAARRAEAPVAAKVAQVAPKAAEAVAPKSTAVVEKAAKKTVETIQAGCKVLTDSAEQAFNGVKCNDIILFGRKTPELKIAPEDCKVNRQFWGEKKIGSVTCGNEDRSLTVNVGGGRQEDTYVRGRFAGKPDGIKDDQLLLHEMSHFFPGEQDVIHTIEVPIKNEKTFIENDRESGKGLIVSIAHNKGGIMFRTNNVPIPNCLTP
jgi:hypothetical protein